MNLWLKFIYAVVSAISIIVILLHQHPVTYHYALSFLYLLIPFFFLFNAFAIVLLAYKKQWLVILPLLFFFVSTEEIKQTYTLNFKNNPVDTAFRVTSYNVGTFNYKRFYSILDTVTTNQSVNWLAETVKSDVLCLQEFYNNDAIESEQTLEEFSNAGYTYFYTNPLKIGEHEGYFGLITFSKYPIINAGPLVFGDTGINRGVFTDIVVNNDTIRILNIHMKSMTIRVDSNTSIAKPLTLVQNTSKILGKLQVGFLKRNEEVQTIGKFIDSTPYPVILCGDLNETPYSYVYSFLRKKLKNTFEEAGSGFGFTYNKFPYFIRIDNQFHDSRFKAVYFKAIPNNHLSDHRPVEGHYILNREDDL